MIRKHRLPGFLSCFVAAAFSPVSSAYISPRSPSRPPTRVRAAPAAASADAAARARADNPVARISVCAGDLCQHQGARHDRAGGASDAAATALRDRGLPWPVDAVGCLGACGLGTAIAIEYANGDAVVTDGLRSALAALDLPQGEAHTDDGETAASLPSVGLDLAVNDSAQPPLLADARDRMRADAPGEAENPWRNMASYLAKKAADSLLRSK